MKNNLVFRIIGAFSSSLIILSVFMSFTNITTISLWDMYNNLGMLYMPIMIIIFGCIGVLFFSLNIKTEFAYATSGAMIFFTVMQLVQAIMNDSFLSLGLGFYFVAIGGIATGIMAFLCNLNKESKKAVGVNKSLADNQISNMMVNMETPSVTYNNQNSVSQNIVPQQSIAQDHITNPIIMENQNPSIPEVNNTNVNQTSQPISINNDNNQNSNVMVTAETKPLPNIEQGMQANTLPNHNPNLESLPIQNVNSNPIIFDNSMNSNIDNSVSANQNPVIRDFVNTNVQQSQPINNSSNSSNMQNLDIFGNFN